MERPEVSRAAEELYEFIEAFVDEDEETGWEAILWCEAVMGGTPQKILGWVTDRDDMPGWAYLFNADLADADALPWLSQLNGTRLRADMTVNQQRAAIKSPAGFERGTPSAIKAAPVNYLTGTKTVYIREREEDKAYVMRIRTLIKETPNQATVIEALMLQKPAGIILHYEAIEGQDWIDVEEKFATWEAVKAKYATWADVKMDVPA